MHLAKRNKPIQTQPVQSQLSVAAYLCGVVANTIGEVE